MKRIPLPLWITIAVLSGLLLSSVVAQPGAYNISAWIVAGGGGGSTGGAYGLDGTIGQAAAGPIAGGSYTLESGYWAFEDAQVIEERRGFVYLPMVSRPIPVPTRTPTRTPSVPPTRTPTSTPEVSLPCNDQEPNEGEEFAAPLRDIGQACRGSFVNPSDDVDDWYEVNLDAGRTITVDLSSIPAGDNYDVYLYIRGNQGTPVQLSANPGSANEHFTYPVPTTSRYYVRVYDKSPTTASAKTYILKVNIS
jgi:hypothetical protein